MARAEEGVRDRQPFGSLVGAGKQVVFAPQGDTPEVSLRLTIVDLESTVGEAASPCRLLIRRVLGRDVQRRLGDQARVQFVDPPIQLVDDGERLLVTPLLPRLVGQRLFFAGCPFGKTV
jgi:hypothetical protein